MGIDALDHLAIEIKHEAEHAVRRRVLRTEIDGEFAVLGLRRCGLDLGGHASTFSAALASFAAMPRLKRSQLTMKRSWVPDPISSIPS
jgi:hypothetical protein